MVMGTKKSQKPDHRGGRRENAGRKPTWNNKGTITIRVPKLIATQVMLLARRLDSGENSKREQGIGNREQGLRMVGALDPHQRVPLIGMCHSN
jgi:hypothetical protein